MKKLYTSFFAVCVAAAAVAQDCSDLFISEYVEGDNNNKAIEIYNPTPAAISLANNYRLVRYSNGQSQTVIEADPKYYINLGNPSIPSGGVYVWVIDKRNPSGTGTEIQADPALQAKANAFICPDYNVNRTLYQNGNDALALQKYDGSAWKFVDIFACIGECPIGYSSETGMTLGTCDAPTSGWTALAPYAEPPAGYNTSLPPAGQGFYFKRVWTQDHTLRRKAGVKKGVTTNPALKTWNVSTEWDSVPNNTFSGLGSHTCDCGLASVNETVKGSASASLYPNPSQGNFWLAADKPVKEIMILNLLGQPVKTIENGSPVQARDINAEDLPPGSYLVSLTFTDESTLIKRISITR